MPKTVDSVADSDRPFKFARGNADGSVTLYYDGDVVPEQPAPSPEEIAKRISAIYAEAVQQMLDGAAQAFSYDGILSMSSYAGDSHPKFGREGDAAKTWRTACWDKCYAIMLAVESGNRQMPTADELLSEMPALGL